MPTYQYACTNPETRHEFEVVQSFTDPAVAVCPECGTPVRKVYGSVGVVFKGSGFYRTDSRESGKKAAVGSSSDSSSGSGSGKDGGSATGSGSASKDSGGSSSSKPAEKSSSGSSTGSSGGSKAAKAAD